MNLLEKILPKSRLDALEERESEKQYPVNARKRRRLDDAYRNRRREKGSRAFNEQQRKAAFVRGTVAAQLHVLETREPGDPMYDNVYNALLTKHGAGFTDQ